jgi:hypothetical protein
MEGPSEEFRMHIRERMDTQHIGVLAGQQLVGNLGSGHPWPLGHRGAPFVDLVEQTDDSQAPRRPNSHLTADAVTPHSATRPSEIRQTMHPGPARPGSIPWRDIAANKIDELDDRIAKRRRLEALRHLLAHHHDVLDCPRFWDDVTGALQGVPLRASHPPWRRDPLPRGPAGP